MARILIDPAHGGKDKGATGNELEEKNLALEAGLKIGKRLEQMGNTVGYTRTDDTYIWVYERGLMAEGYDFLVSIHFNSNEGRPGTGSEVIVSNAETYAGRAIGYRDNLKRFFVWREIYSRKNSDGTIVVRTVDEETKMFNEIVEGENYYGILRGAESVGVNGDILEICFLNNPNDMRVYMDNKEEILSVIANAINTNKYRIF